MCYLGKIQLWWGLKDSTSVLGRIWCTVSSSNLSWSTRAVEILLAMIWEVCYFLIITCSSLVAHFTTLFLVPAVENQWHWQKKNSWCFFLIDTWYEFSPKPVMMYREKRFGALLTSVFHSSIPLLYLCP